MVVGNQTTDDELLKAVRNESEEAFEILFRRYANTVRRIARSKIKSADVADEIVQDFFMKLWDQRHSLQVEHFESYVYFSIKNRCLNHIKACVVRERYWDYYKQFLPHDDQSTEKEVLYRDLRLALEEGLQRIPDKSKKVFTLSRLEGRSVKEIARQLNLSEKAIEYHLTRSLKELRMYLKDFILMVAAAVSQGWF